MTSSSSSLSETCNNLSWYQRLSADATNAYQDVYNNWILGDEAGKAALFTLVIHHPAKLGLTFLEINGRAYVQSVWPGSAADQAGIAPQDCVQYAAVVRPEWIQQEQEQPSPTENTTSCPPTSLAVQYVLNLESQGARLSYDQLRHLLMDSRKDQADAIDAAFLSPTTDILPTTCQFMYDQDTWKGPPIPSNVCVPMRQTTTTTTIQQYYEHDTTNNSCIQDASSPVVLIFRRTRQRKKTTNPFLPYNFRLDDECDFSAKLVQRLAPTADMDLPPPDAWEELVHDGTDWLLGHESILPPTTTTTTTTNNTTTPKKPTIADDEDEEEEEDVFENLEDEDETTSKTTTTDMDKRRAIQLANLRQTLMSDHNLLSSEDDDIEAATIRGMIQKAVGLAFVRASKIVLGVSVHGGSGIVISRLSDGTWSAPSAIGTWGLGLGLQFGLEVAEYIFILQTQEALEHFRVGGSYTVGGNMGIAVAGLGREAYGAASLGGSMCGNVHQVNEDQYNDNDSRYRNNNNNNNNRMSGDNHHQTTTTSGIAPIVAYAKSQGLYVGVSLEGSRIFTRNDINSRVYKFATVGRAVTAADLLSGKVPTPPEAEGLYAALHSVEFAHEMSCLPRPPEVLRRDAASAWHFDQDTLGEATSTTNTTTSNAYSTKPKKPRFSFLSDLSQDEKEQCDAFETQFKNFLYGGVSVQRLLTDNMDDMTSSSSRKNKTTPKERRTLWLMLPEVGSLRLGFVSKLSDGETLISNVSSTRQACRRGGDDRSQYGDLGTVGSEELTLDSAIQTRDGSTIGPIRNGNVQLSDKHSVALTDITIITQEPLAPVRFAGGDKMQHLRIISIQDVAGTCLYFLANNFREAELLVCGLKLLLERETNRLGVRGGLPITALGGKSRDGIMSPAAARGFRELPSKISTQKEQQNERKKQSRRQKEDLRKKHSQRSPNSVIQREDSLFAGLEDSGSIVQDVPEGRTTWAKVPGRNYMRRQASGLTDHADGQTLEQGFPRYVHGQLLRKSISKHVRLPLPLPLCRVLLLDSTSPVIQRWEKDRGDQNFDKTRWAFPPTSPRELESHPSEHQLIASGSMSGAHRTTSFDRPRYGSLVRLSETHAVDLDDPRKVAFTIIEHNPRRGFSIKVRINLKASRGNLCEANVVADIRPIGKDMSNQAAVHKAFLLVMDEIRMRYGLEGKGLLAEFVTVVDKMAEERNSSPVEGNRSPGRTTSLSRPFRRTDPFSEEKKSDYSSSSNTSCPKTPPRTSGLVSFEDMLKTGRQSPEPAKVDRPSTPSLLRQVPDANPAKRIADNASIPEGSDSFVTPIKHEEKAEKKKGNVLIEVKPLPKIRLSLMPSPREEDEYTSDSSSLSPSKPVKRKKKKKRASSRTGRHGERSPSAARRSQSHSRRSNSRNSSTILI